jgi:SagB-type dehydrogenase family enzyme
VAAVEGITDMVLAEASAGVNAYRVVSPDFDAVGVRTHQARYDNVTAGVTEPGVVQDYLVASRYLPWDRQALLSAADYYADVMAATLSLVDEDTPPKADVVTLPNRVDVPIALDEAIARRRSVRRFSGDPVDLAELATMLRFAGGVTAEADVELMRGGTVTYRFRTVPSGGGLYPIELQLAVFDVDGLDVGIYRYSPVLDVLVRTGDRAQVDRLRDTLAIPGDIISVDSAAAIVLFVAHPWRSTRKYGPRGLRFVLHEVGGMAQNLHLTAAGLGLGSVDCSSYIDDLANEALDLDGQTALLAHMVFVGWPG